MAMVGERILAVREDDENDPLWESLGLQYASSIHAAYHSRSGTLFSAICAAKDNVALNGVLQLDDESSYLEIRFSVFIHRGLLSSNLVCGRTMDSLMQPIIHFIFPPFHGKDNVFTDNAIKDLYAHLNSAADSNPSPGVQHKDLLPKLLPFQQRSVTWCLKRECGVVDGFGNVVYQEPSMSEKLPLTWEVVTAASGENLFINRLCGRVCIADEILVAQEPEPRGGILAEEMGLGKTVEVLALILLNRRKAAPPLGVLEDQLLETHLLDDLESEYGNNPQPLIWSGATLIITPPSIVHQWVSEIERHAPTLRVFIYVDDSHTAVEAALLAQYDVVLTTYTMLAKELDYAVHYDRPRRHRQRYKPRKSSFVQIDWWRVCLDEAQMIEVPVSRAATMAGMIPRVMSWAISGTPVKRHLEDLHSLLRFLKQEPLGSNKQMWKLLNHKVFRSTLITSYQQIMSRFSKRDIEQELSLPRQSRVVYGIEFSDIERANYNQLWETCLSECELAFTDQNLDEVDTERFQSWLMRLRQTCCHPQIGARNKESLGGTNLRTIDEVLDVMIAQVTTQLYQKERSEGLCRVKRAVLQTRIHPATIALPFFRKTEQDVLQHVMFWKKKYDLKFQNYKESEMESDIDVSDETALEAQLDLALSGKAGASDSLAIAALRHREWLEQQHRVLFYMAGTYHALNMETEENSFYEKAEAIRQQLLQLPEQKFEKQLALVQKRVDNISLDSLYSIETSLYKGGIVMSRIMADLDTVSEALNVQLQTLRRWRQDLVSRLTQPLMRDGEEGEQYQYSIDLQHTLESYLHFYVKLLVFRKDLISGSEDSMANHHKVVQSQRDHAAMVKLRESRVRSFKRKAGELDETKKPEDLDKNLEKELFDLITPNLTCTLRSIRTNIRSVLKEDSLPRAEIAIAELEDSRVKEMQNVQSKLILELEREIPGFRQLTASRTVYYRQLQAISDTVLDIESTDPEADIDACLKEETLLQKDIIRLVAKQRYLEHIATTSKKQSPSADSTVCLICRSPYEVGLMTDCGHIFCEHCLLEWTKNKAYAKCPSCNSQISRKNLSRVGFRGSSIPVLTSTQEPATRSEPVSDRVSIGCLSKVRMVPEAIRRVAIIDGYGSKVDSIVRHIVYLVQEDPETKCLVFSQWTSLLALIADSLEKNMIGMVKLQGNLNSAVKQFKENKNKHVFMLHAKSQSAGLTLIDATHVFICEPLVNPVLQAQAVSRVHRIGQRKETFVYYYLVLNSVEIPCFDLSN
ncbi:E3 ubiquitin-protein ligase SHPRH [Entomortierella parvispora]|uniref:E3 ubiquitin-protein ligase SHPRH n=1 Tax=Entomortierella parvispora TaxID=205924 RepID=A0A9P3LU53_9FUNG|nr:E3 ubiquitin-protein ligase SHPRH [Entomortierella parvispora]